MEVFYYFVEEVGAVLGDSRWKSEVRTVLGPSPKIQRPPKPSSAEESSAELREGGYGSGYGFSRAESGLGFVKRQVQEERWWGGRQ